MLSPQNWGMAGQAEGPEVLGRHLKPGRGLGVRGKGKGPLTFVPPLPQNDLTTAIPLSHRNHSLPFSGWDASLLLPAVSPEVIYEKQELKGVVQPSWQKHLWV